VIFLPPNVPTLLYERSHFVESGSYAEAVSFCETLAKRSPFAKIIRFGTSPEGRPMIALLMSAKKEFTPQALAKSPRPLIFVNNGIHAGEIEGKDASLMLVRGMLLEGKHKDLFQGANWLMIPIYNVDGHERKSKYNRINQNGPIEMGWRSTGQNLNLNRDYMKADAPETRAWLGLLHRYQPDFLFDDHTTDGADYRYSAMLSVPQSPVLPPATADFSKRLYDEVKLANDAKGVLTAPYFEVDRNNIGRGLTVEDFTPRYTHGYFAALGRPSMLIETHMLKDYKTRVEATYQTLVATSTFLVKNASRLKTLNHAADAPVKEGDTVVFASKPSAEKRPFTFLGWRYAPAESPSAGSPVAAWVHDPVDTVTTVQDQYLPGASGTAPAGYAIPAAWTDVIDRLRLHGLPVKILKSPMTGSFSSARFDGVRFATRPFEGRFQPSFTVRPVTETRVLAPGTAIVPASRLAMQLLEPDAPDSLLKWGLFNNVFEQKEYFEDYSMAVVGDAMLANDPKLKAEFEAWLVKSPNASKNDRLGWLFDRSPYADRRLNAYPVVRLIGAQLRQLEPLLSLR